MRPPFHHYCIAALLAALVVTLIGLLDPKTAPFALRAAVYSALVVVVQIIGAYAVTPPRRNAKEVAVYGVLAALAQLTAEFIGSFVVIALAAASVMSLSFYPQPALVIGAMTALSAIVFVGLLWPVWRWMAPKASAIS